jgi:hypothetical protein
MRHLPRDEESLHQLTFSPRDQARKAFEPFAFGDFGIGIAPVAESPHLIEADFSLPNSKRKMTDQRVRQLVTTNFRHDFYFSP